MTPPPLPKAGDVVHLTRAASVQFIKPIFLRVVRVMTERVTYDQWIWIEGYQLDAKGDAVEKRTLFVLRDGLRIMRPRVERRAPVTRKANRQASRQPSGPVSGQTSGAAGDRGRRG